MEDSDKAELGTNFVDFKFGTKVLLAEGWALSGAVSVPVNEAGLRPIAVGTVGLEAYF